MIPIAPPPPMATPPMPRRSDTWPGSSWEPGLNVMSGKPRALGLRPASYARSHRSPGPSQVRGRCIGVPNRARRAGRHDVRPCRFMTNGRSGAAPTGPIVWSSRTDRRTPRPSTGGASTLRRDAGRRRSRHICPCGGPSTIPPNDPLVDEAARRRVAALVAQEALDIRDQVVAGWQSLLVVHRLQPLDVAARRLVEAGRGVEPRPQLACLLFQLACGDGGTEVVSECAEELQRRGRVRPGHVMRYLREVAE